MSRYLFNLICAISLLVCLLAAALYVRSRFVGEQASIADVNLTTRTWYFIELESNRGRIFYEIDRGQQLGSGPMDPLRTPTPGWTYARRPPPDKIPSKLWDGESGINSRGTRMTFGSIALWPVPIVAAVLPIFWLIERVRRSSVSRVGCSIVCGYDLRATPDRCPECGAVPASASQSALAAEDSTTDEHR